MTMTSGAASKTADRVAIAAAAALGAVSIGLFAWDARPTLVALNWLPRDALAWDAGLSLLFFGQHSTMVRRPFRARLARVIPERYGGLVYAIASGVALLLVVVLWQRVDTPVYRLEGASRWIAVALSGLAAALFVYSGYAVRRTIDIFGLRPIRAHLRGWIVVGTVFEERDLVADFGGAYRRFQQRVPMLVPWRGPVSV